LIAQKIMSQLGPCKPATLYSYQLSNNDRRVLCNSDARYCALNINESCLCYIEEVAEYSNLARKAKYFGSVSACANNFFSEEQQDQIKKIVEDTMAAFKEK
jgi:hypothetical protein